MTAPGLVRDQPGGRWPLSYRAVPVPFVVAWSTEDATDVASGDLVLRTEAFTGRWQVRYRDEQATDRDRHGILWHRVAWAPGQGKPLYAEIHTMRQRSALSLALCQICAAPAQIWMTPALLWDEHLAEHGPAVPYPTNDPPVCRPCAVMAARYCPELDSRKFAISEVVFGANLRPRSRLAGLGGISSGTGVLVRQYQFVICVFGAVAMRRRYYRPRPALVAGTPG